MGLQKVVRFFKDDVVLTASLVLAAASCLLVPPSPGYLSYIDWDTLLLLFCLMLLIEGLGQLRFFQRIGQGVLGRVSTARGLALTLIFLCFLSSMFITNDVALITFVPFGIMVLEMAGMTGGLCRLITLMTIAGNLGSMLTPMGNPQNLYLYGLSGMRMGEFLLLMLPYTALAALLLAGAALLWFKGEKRTVELEAPAPLDWPRVGFYLGLFLLCLLGVAGLLSRVLMAALVTLGVLWQDRQLFRRVDYGLLLTFVFFFIFVGNLNSLEGLPALLRSLLSGRERLAAIGISQIISNVPAAMLLSSYTDNIRELIVGTNLGGLGTLIASMASLISYKRLTGPYPQLRRPYLLTFTVCNVVFLAVLCLL